MRKTQVALAAAALVASSVALADVSISGIVDAGYTNANGGMMASGLLAPNFLTFSGSEDIGNGMKAHFELRNRIFMVDGTVTDTLFTSFVGLSGDFGTLNLGRTFDAFWANGIAQFDVTGGGNMGSTALDPVLGFGLSGTNAPNAVHYISPNIAGLTLSGTYSSASDNTSSLGTKLGKSAYSYTATYANGPLTLGAGQASNVSEGYFLGGGYDLGIAKINVNYISAKDLGHSTGINAAIPVAGALTATVGYNQTKVDAVPGTTERIVQAYTATGNTNMVSVGLKYALSKRTTVFGNYQSVTNDGKLFVGMADKAATADKDAVVIGVSHAF